ncbi:NusG domain II-containing protein [Paenibacillus sp. FA6]|uniref:NusG domain II-containing protein n=1 Tax=Paenibacillus sp. FA6 TaxID=3413029 RepID=UPI003F65E14E
MKRGDLLIITIIAAVALFFLVPRWFPGDASENNHIKNLTADITLNGKLFKTIELTKEEQIIEIKSTRGTNVIKVHDYGVEMYDTDCPDKVCQTFGFIDRPKQSIICLPHRVMVEINGVQDVGDEPDVIVN